MAPRRPIVNETYREKKNSLGGFLQIDFILGTEPHYDAIPAGNPREMNPEGQMWMDIVFSRGKETWYTLRVVGDSMSHDYLNGDVVLMDYALQPHDGDIVAALADDSERALKT